MVPDEPQIYANAGKDKMGIAGADVLFEGKALGIKKNHWKMLGIFGILATVLPAREKTSSIPINIQTIT